MTSDALAIRQFLYETYYDYSVAPERLVHEICDTIAIKRLLSGTFDV